MKKAEKLAVVVKNQVNNEVTFVLPLAAFGKAFDGPAIDPKVLEERRETAGKTWRRSCGRARRAGRRRGGDAAAPAPAAEAAGQVIHRRVDA